MQTLITHNSSEVLDLHLLHPELYQWEMSFCLGLTVILSNQHT